MTDTMTFRTSTSKFPLKALPAELLLDVADCLPVSSYTSLALICHSLYKLLDHRRWAGLRAEDPPEWAQLVPRLATGRLEVCTSCQSLHDRDDLPLLKDTGINPDGSKRYEWELSIWGRPRYMSGQYVRQVALPATDFNGTITYEPILDITAAHLEALRTRRLEGHHRKLNEGICVDRMSVKERMTALLPWGGKSVNISCTTKAAFFPRVRLQPQELGLHAKLRIELSPCTYPGHYLFLESSQLESYRKKSLLAHLGYISRFFETHRHIKGFLLDSRLPKEIVCKLTQLLGPKWPSSCTCVKGQPNSSCETSTAKCNTRCEVNLIDALTFEVDIWSLLPPFPRHGAHTADDVPGLFREAHLRCRGAPGLIIRVQMTREEKVA
jgi:hypothetical protein